MHARKCVRNSQSEFSAVNPLLMPATPRSHAAREGTMLREAPFDRYMTAPCSAIFKAVRSLNPGGERVCKARPRARQGQWHAICRQSCKLGSNIIPSASAVQDRTQSIVQAGMRPWSRGGHLQWRCSLWRSEPCRQERCAGLAQRTRELPGRTQS